MRCRTEVGPDGQQQSVMALVWVNARFRLHLRSPGAACRRPSGIIRPSAPLPSVAARAVRRQTRNKLFGSTRALPASVMCLESLHVCTLLALDNVTVTLTYSNVMIVTVTDPHDDVQTQTDRTCV